MYRVDGLIQATETDSIHTVNLSEEQTKHGEVAKDGIPILCGI